MTHEKVEYCVLEDTVEGDVAAAVARGDGHVELTLVSEKAGITLTAWLDPDSAIELGSEVIKSGLSLKG